MWLRTFLSFAGTVCACRTAGGSRRKALRRKARPSQSCGHCDGFFSAFLLSAFQSEELSQQKARKVSFFTAQVAEKRLDEISYCKHTTQFRSQGFFDTLSLAAQGSSLATYTPPLANRASGGEPPNPPRMIYNRALQVLWRNRCLA
jgi:hypothetical protein